MNTKGAPLFVLEQIRKRYPVALHGVALSIGSAEGVDLSHLRRIRNLSEHIEPFQISDHLCFSRHGKTQYHELLPLPRTWAMLRRLLANIDRVQNYLKRQLVIENISAYREYPENEIPEPEFLNLLAEKSGCRLLLDINNIYVNAANFRFNARRYLRAINPAYVEQYHLAGYTDMHTHLFDTHAEPVHRPVIRLFQEAKHHLGERRFSLERDDRIPSLSVLIRETERLAHAAATPMPRRFDSAPAKSTFMPGTGKQLNLEREIRWQSTFYSGPVLNGETKCGDLSARSAQKIYRDGYQIRCQNALAEKFPLLFAAVGERKSVFIQKEFIADVASVDADLAHYGDHLPEWLRTRYGQKTAWRELAELDLLQFNIFHAATEPPVADLFQSRVHLAQTSVIWSGSSTQIRVSAGRAVALPTPKRGTQHLLCYRDAFAVKTMELSEGQLRFTQSLKKPAYLSALLGRAEREFWLSPQEVKGLFRVLGIAGVLTCRQTTS